MAVQHGRCHWLAALSRRWFVNEHRRRMMRQKPIGVICCLLAITAIASAQENKMKDERRTSTKILDHTVANLEHQFVPAAEAMPEDKFGFAPTTGEFKGVRNFGQQIKHVAAVNYQLGAAILEQKPPADIGDESGPTSMTSKSVFSSTLTIHLHTCTKPSRPSTTRISKKQSGARLAKAECRASGWQRAWRRMVLITMVRWWSTCGCRSSENRITGEPLSSCAELIFGRRTCRSDADG